MKKNTMMRIASVLMVAVLLSTCAISSTFAKYVSSDSATDTARIAKWGVTVSAYNKNTSFNNTYTTSEQDATITVKTQNDSDDHIIAPGTSGSLGGISISGTPEVMVDVSVNATLTLSGWHTDGNENNTATEHCPLIFYVGGEEIKIGDNNIATIDDLQAAVVGKFTALTEAGIAANTNLGTKNVSVSWEWPYDGDHTQDTALGNIANTALTDTDPTTVAPTITFSCSATVTQVD